MLFRVTSSYTTALALARPQQPADSLHVLALAESTAHDHGDVGVRNVEPFVEHPC